MSMIRIHRCLYVDRDRIGGLQLAAKDTRIDVFRNDEVGQAIVRFGAASCDVNRTVAEHFNEIVEQIRQVDINRNTNN